MNLAILSPNQNKYSETFIQSHRRIPNTQVFYYYAGKVPSNLQNYGRLIPEKISERIIFEFSKRIKFKHFNTSEYALARSLKENRIDCVLAEYGTTGVENLNICKELKLPLIVHFHGYDASSTKVIEEYGERYIDMFDYSQYVIAVSNTMVTKLLELGCPKEKLKYIPYGPDNDYYFSKPDYNSKTIVATGRFVDKKAPYYLILAFSKILNNHPDSKLVLIGDGMLLNSCINLVKYLKIESKVIFTGVLGKEEIINYFNKSSIFVQHSITALNGDMEGTPLSILEAGIAGLPVVSTRHAGISDVVINGETGLLSNEHDVDSMVKNLNQLLNEPLLAEELGKKAKNYIHEKYNIDNYLDGLSDLILNTKKVN